MRPYWSRWHIGMELQQIEAILETVAVSSLIGCTSLLAARAPLTQDRVIQLKVPDIDLRRKFYILSHREKYVTAGILSFLNIVLDFRQDSSRELFDV